MSVRVQSFCRSQLSEVKGMFFFGLANSLFVFWSSCIDKICYFLPIRMNFKLDTNFDYNNDTQSMIIKYKQNNLVTFNTVNTNINILNREKN